MAPNKELTSYKHRQNILEIIGHGGLDKWGDVNLIERYALNFGLDPDSVYVDVSFDTLTMFHIKWKQEVEHKEKYDEIERMMSETKG